MTTPPAGQPRTKGEIVASNLLACDIICERDIERVANQINAAILEGGDSPANRPIRTPQDTNDTRRTDAPVIPSEPASRAAGQPDEAKVDARYKQIWLDAFQAAKDVPLHLQDAHAGHVIAIAQARAVAEATVELRAQLTKAYKRDGNWLDEWGSCRVCGGEIPYGHTENCDLYKMEKTERELRAQLEAAQERERVAIASWDEEQQRALREASRVVERGEKLSTTEAALREAQKDSARLDWLENQALEEQKRIDHGKLMAFSFLSAFNLPPLTRSGIDAAIDAAALPKEGEK
jgi:hypothetical protein